MSYYKYLKQKVKIKIAWFYYCYSTVEMTCLYKLILQSFFINKVRGPPILSN